MNQLSSPKNPKILVIEDDSTAVDMIRPALRNYSIDTLSTPNQAINLIDKNDYELLLVDLHFHPDPYDVFAGIDFIKTCRAKGIQTPIVVISNFDQLEEKALNAGANKFLSKKSYHPKKWKEILASLTIVPIDE